MLLRNLVKFLEHRGSWRMINRRNAETGETEPYLKRYYIFASSHFNILLHQFWSSDPDDLHTHPWNNITILLKGGYKEYHINGECDNRQPGFFTYRQADVFHRIALLDESKPGKTWSLFLHFKRLKKWGFLSGSKWIEAGEYGKMVDAPVLAHARRIIEQADRSMT